MKEIMYSDLMSIKIGASGAEQSHVDGLIGISQGTADLGANGSGIARRQAASFRLGREPDTRLREMDAGRAHLLSSSPDLRARFLRIDSPLSSIR